MTCAAVTLAAFRAGRIRCSQSSGSHPAARMRASQAARLPSEILLGMVDLDDEAAAGVDPLSNCPAKRASPRLRELPPPA